MIDGTWLAGPTSIKAFVANNVNAQYDVAA
jgi:hypothetical protein